MRSGIKAYISLLGIEANYIETSSLNELENFYQEHYLILDHNLLEKPKGHAFRNLLSYFEGRTLLLASKKMSPSYHQYTILPQFTEDKILEVLKNYFSDLLDISTEKQDEVLSSRETDVLREVAHGYSNKDIADRLFISINTVITHRKNITDKLGIKTIPGLTVYALMNNLINPEDVTL